MLPYKVAWIPCNSELSENKLFDITCARDNAIERFVEAHGLLLKHNCTSKTIDLCDVNTIDVVIFYSLSSELKWLIRAIKKNSLVQFINIPIEPAVVSVLHETTILSAMPFDRIMVWNDDLVVKGKPFVKANIGESIITEKSIPTLPFKKKKFIVAITSSKLIQHKNGLHQERFHAFDFFSKKTQGIDLYGVGWDKTSYPFVQTSYKGLCDTKKDVLQKYKFSICFENAKKYPGLITEKIFDCFAAGTVPIYYGPPNIHDYIPKNCFINFPDFTSYEDLYIFLTEITEAEYQHYLDAAKTFISSPEYNQFTSRRFAEIICEQVQSLMHEPRQRKTVLGFKWMLLKIVLKHPILFSKNIRQCRRFLFDLVFTF